jgi:hypothetical protein
MLPRTLRCAFMLEVQANDNYIVYSLHHLTSDMTARIASVYYYNSKKSRKR